MTVKIFCSKSLNAQYNSKVVSSCVQLCHFLRLPYLMHCIYSWLWSFTGINNWTSLHSCLWKLNSSFSWWSIILSLCNIKFYGIIWLTHLTRFLLFWNIKKHWEFYFLWSRMRSLYLNARDQRKSGYKLCSTFYLKVW